MNLKGLKVLDVSRVMAGPYACQILGDLGADVLKIEHPVGGDDTRSFGPPFLKNQSAYFLSANRNKRSLTCDFKNQNDLLKLNELISEADIFVENFKPKTLEKFGLDFETLKLKNSKLIYCSIEAFGEGSPRQNELGYDILAQALGGLMAVNGNEKIGPIKTGVPISDLVSGLYSVIGILSALNERNRSGIGQRVQVSLVDSTASLLSNIGMSYLSTGIQPKHSGNRHPTIVPYGVFFAKNGPFVLAVGNDTQFQALWNVLEFDGESGKNFVTNESRVVNRKELELRLEAQFLTKDREDWIKVFELHKIPSSSILEVNQIMNDPHFKFQDTFSTMSDGETPNIKSPLRFSKSKIEYRCPPDLGKNNGESWEKLKV